MSRVTPLSSVSPALQGNGDYVECRVVRVYPLRTDRQGRDVLTAQLQDPIKPSDPFLDLVLTGPWSHLPLHKNDVVRITYPQVHENTSKDSLDHKYYFELNGTGACERSTMVVRGWRDRIIGDEGRAYTLAQLKKEVPDGPRRTKKAKRDEYIYSPLRELEAGSPASFYAVILDYTHPKETKGTDMMVSLTVVDKTKHDIPVTVNVFKSHVEKLPLVLRRGDIFRAHRARIQTYLETTQALLSSTGKHSFVCLHGAMDAPLEPYCKSDGNYHAIDEAIVCSLREWASEHPSLFSSGKCDKKIEELTSDLFCDLTVQVIHIRPDEDGRSIIYAWDGTAVQKPMNKLYHVPRQQMTIQHPFGSVLPIKLLRQQAEVSVGDIVHLRNVSVTCSDLYGLSAAITKESRYTALPQSAKEKVLASFRKASRDLQLKHNTESKTKVFHTVAQHESVHFTSIKAILHAREPIGKFRIRATMINVNPSDLKDCTSIFCSECRLSCPCSPQETIVCSTCDSSAHCSVQYLFCIEVQDPTGQLPVHVAGKEAERFLHGLPPVNLYTNEHALSALEKRFMALAGQDSVMDLCVMSYPHASGNGVRVYRLFDTSLVLDDSK